MVDTSKMAAKRSQRQETRNTLRQGRLEGIHFHTLVSAIQCTIYEPRRWSEGGKRNRKVIHG